MTGRTYKLFNFSILVTQVLNSCLWQNVSILEEMHCAKIQFMFLNKATTFVRPYADWMEEGYCFTPKTPE